VVIGSAIAAAGLGALWLLVAPMHAAGAFAVVLAVVLGLVGIGFGLGGSPRQAAALESVPVSEVGMAASTYFTGRYLGGVLGASLAGLVLNQAVTAGAIAIGLPSSAVAAWSPSSRWAPGRRRSRCPSS
jgi:hypothetical protein